MGTNKRYSAHYDRLMEHRVDEMVMRGEPTTLSDRELQLDVQPLTRYPVPMEAKAWIRYGDQAVHVPVRVVASTPRACAVKWDAPGGEHKAWVWASAVDSG